MSAISISDTVDFTHRGERESRYLEIISSYPKQHQGLFPDMFTHLVMALEEKAQTTGPEDVLGVIFHDLELHNKYKGQFFTPQPVADCMAKMTCGNKEQADIKEKGYLSMCEPACGSGVMVMAFCKAMAESGMNYSTQLVVTAVDVDIKCVHMAFLQLSLYGIPAVVIHGNTLSCEEWSRWYTPIYILNDWAWREPCRINAGPCVEDEMLKCASQPMYAAMRKLQGKVSESLLEKETKPAANKFYFDFSDVV